MTLSIIDCNELNQSLDSFSLKTNDASPRKEVTTVPFTVVQVDTLPPKHPDLPDAEQLFLVEAHHCICISHPHISPGAKVTITPQNCQTYLYRNADGKAQILVTEN